MKHLHHTKNPLEWHYKPKNLGDRIADRIATFGGSWTFIISFFVLLFFWMGLNTLILAEKVFDSYPFILLNLVLSCLAAVQAPIILMSQNRQAERDRLQALHDFQVNLKAEKEVRNLHQKIDEMHKSLEKKIDKLRR